MLHDKSHTSEKLTYLVPHPSKDFSYGSFFSLLCNPYPSSYPLFSSVWKTKIPKKIHYGLGSNLVLLVGIAVFHFWQMRMSVCSFDLGLLFGDFGASLANNRDCYLIMEEVLFHPLFIVNDSII